MSDALQEAHRLYTESLDALREQRTQIQEDLEFSDPSNPQQWDAMVKLSRETDPGGKRPCLVMDQTSQYVQQVSGQIERQTPSIHAIPLAGGADKKAAEQIDGRFRHIEHASRAQQHYNRALTSAARAGVGYLIVRPCYVNRALNWQEPRISSQADALKVIFDPWSVDTDGADCNFAFELNPLSIREFERRWPNAEQRDFGDAEQSKKDDTRKSVLLAEGWTKKEETQKVIVYTDAQGQEESDTEEEYAAACQAAGVELPVTNRYTDKKTCVIWRQMSGAEILEETEYPADSIGVVPVYGYIGFANGRMKYCGIPRRARNPQQAYNYHISEQLAYIGTAPKSPWMVSKRAAAGVETIWDRASQQSRAWLPYNDLDEDGAIAAPQRVSPSTSLVNHEAGAERALRDIEAAVAMYRANLGAPSNETSGVAIDARKEQGEASNAHFPSHLQASLGRVGEIVLQMDARLSDTRRKVPIIGVDGSPGSVVFDPDQEAAFQRVEGDASVNPTVGSYGVRVVVGASYATQRSQTNAAFGEIMRTSPALAQVVAPFWAQTLDFPGSDKFAQAMAAMAPPAVKAILQPEGGEQGPDPAALAHQLEQCKQALQEAIQHAHDAQADADAAIAAKADARRLAEVRERELDIQAYKAESERLKVTGANEGQIQAIVRDLVESMLRQPEPLPGDDDPQPGAMAWQPQSMPMQGGPGLDGSAMHEQGEAAQLEAQEQQQEGPEAGETPIQPEGAML